MFFGLIIALLQAAGQAAGAEHAVPFALACGQIQSQIQIEMTALLLYKAPHFAVGAHARQMQVGIAANPQIKADQAGNVAVIGGIELRNAFGACYFLRLRGGARRAFEFHDFGLGSGCRPSESSLHSVSSSSTAPVRESVRRGSRTLRSFLPSRA